jgi:predicted AlkP superfamily phosphohydrolase/phosphomutase
MVGGGQVHSKEKDGANHNWDGILLMAEGKDLAGSRPMAPVQGMRLYDVAPTVLEALKFVVFRKKQGGPIQWPLAQAV